MSYYSLRREKILLPTNKMGFDFLSIYKTLSARNQNPLKPFQVKEANKNYSSTRCS